MIPPPIPTPEFHIRVDESYGLKPEDNFLLNFLIIKGKEDYRFLKDLISGINLKYGYKESKSNQINLAAKTEIFKSIAKTNFSNYIFLKKKYHKKDVLNLYSQGLEKFLEQIGSIIPEKSKIFFRLDNMGGHNFQHKCIKSIRTAFKKLNCRIIAEFRESKSEETLQLTDILAGEYRRFLIDKNNTEFTEFLDKNKNLI